LETGVDTSALYYYVTDARTLRPSERQAAKRAAASIDLAYDSGKNLAIPSTVVIELANILHHRNGARACQAVLEALLQDSRNALIPADESSFTEALILSRKLGVKYTDCVIYLTLKKAGAIRLITADKEFAAFKDLTLL